MPVYANKHGDDIDTGKSQTIRKYEKQQKVVNCELWIIILDYKRYKFNLSLSLPLHSFNTNNRHLVHIYHKLLWNIYI